MELELFKKAGIHSFDIFKQSWLLGARKFLPLVIAWFLTLLVPLFIGGCLLVCGAMFDQWFFHRAGYATLLGCGLLVTMLGWCWAGWNYVCLKIARGITPRFTDLFRPFSQCSSGFLALMMTSIAIGLGMCCFVLPGAYLFLKFQFTGFYIVDRDMGPIEAMKESWKDTDRLFVPLAFMDLMFWSLHFISGAIFIGPFLCFMAHQVANAVAYNTWLVDEDVTSITHDLYAQITASKAPTPHRLADETDDADEDASEDTAPDTVLKTPKKKQNERLQ